MSTKIEDKVKLTPPASGCLYAKDAKFACDYARRLVPTLAALGNNAAEREANWARGGYELYTSIDLKQQDVAQASIDKNAPAKEKRFKLGVGRGVGAAGHRPHPADGAEQALRQLRQRESGHHAPR